MNPLPFLEFGFRDVMEILLIAGILFYLYRWIRGTFAIQAAAGVVVIILVNAFVSLLGFTTLSFILRGILDVGLLAVIILFQPELRQLLYNLGQNRAFDRFLNTSTTQKVIDEVVKASREMAQQKTGAIIVFSLGTRLQDLISEGVRLDAEVSAGLLKSIFQKDSTLHDGAVIIRGNRIVTASALLPTSSNTTLSQEYGTRHRAAIGITERNRAYAVVLSEERGKIGLAVDGNLEGLSAPQMLRTRLEALLLGPSTADQESDFSLLPKTKKPEPATAS
ncbi:MAG: diadenylate cyclase CdaA [Balneolaceae bacterium]|nr:diadenylate cyclase CdaA [Balneolaceae bacterium]MDR9446597.1 diadenylate cyclase CdaA [Balneolaceae bacterium]